MAVSEPRKGMQNVAKLFQPLDEETRQCETHGEYVASLFRVPSQPPREIWSPCPGCEQDRVRLEDQAIVAEAQEARRQAKLEQLIGRAAIPKRFTNRTLANYRTDEPGPAKQHGKMLRYAEHFAEHRDQGTSLILCGNPGTGKTHLAVGVIKRVMEAGYTGSYTRMLEIARAVKETYRPDSPRTEREVLEEFARPDLLVIDEVGHQHGSDTERMVLFEVINARYDECKPTILITNLALQGLTDYLDERALDRLREGAGQALVFDWQSVRREV